jgi:hypothetical protein
LPLIKLTIMFILHQFQKFTIYAVQAVSCSARGQLVHQRKRLSHTMVSDGKSVHYILSCEHTLKTSLRRLWIKLSVTKLRLSQHILCNCDWRRCTRTFIQNCETPMVSLTSPSSFAAGIWYGIPSSHSGRTKATDLARYFTRK